VAYADLFDYPLMAEEIHRYLAGVAAPLEAVEASLAQDGWLCDRLECDPPFWFLRGRHDLVRLRQRRAIYAEALWVWARRSGAWVALVPFVRLVAISGSLTMDNVNGPHDDIDLLIVTRAGRVWFVRGVILLLRRVLRPLGIHLCPNYLLSEETLRIGEQTVFVAHELAQLVPLYGMGVYRRLMEGNAWTRGYLPNAQAPLMEARAPGRVGRGTKGALEAMLGGRVGDRVERWERERKIPKLRREAEMLGSQETRFSPEVCKGHKHSHGARISESYAKRLKALGL
jgi:hypothetical protein